MSMSQQDKTNYKRKFNEENYARIGLYLKPKEKEQWQSAAEQAGQSLSEFIKKCVNDYLNEGG